MGYRISEVERMLGLPVTTIRYYDREGLLPNVKRSEGGQREFSDADIKLLQVIECLKRTNMPIKDIRRFSRLLSEGDETLEERRQMFYERRETVREQIEGLRAVAELIERKCAYYDAAVAAGTEDGVTWESIDELFK
ncbi:MAG: MerR family transcriptional regulator [Atopobiaceae bacterium]|nr:MerR family transcriptional regulator [Atopobiaceae bacterium]